MGDEMKPLRCFAVHITGRDHETLVNARTAGQAKQEYIRILDDCFPALTFTDLRCRVVGKPHTSEAFQRNAQYRGMPQVQCGARVKVGDSCGTIVGHNSSANFDVLFDEDAPKYAGMRLNVHPNSITLL